MGLIGVTLDFMFQFQLGTIGSLITVDKEINNRVSIPAWYDWEKIESIPDIHHLPSFNSSLVRLGGCES